MIHCRGGRVIVPELLEHAPVEESRRNLREIAAINRYLGGHRILLDRLKQITTPQDAFTFLDVGAASGDMTQVASRSFPRIRAIGLDIRELHLDLCPGLRVAGDAFHLPFRSQAIDVVHCSLFLHHFSSDEVIRLLAEMWRVAGRAVIVQDLERNPLAYYFIAAAAKLFNCSTVLRHDAPVSVEAAFKPEELRSLASEAGIPVRDVRLHRPAFRLSLLAMR